MFSRQFLRRSLISLSNITKPYQSFGHSLSSFSFSIFASSPSSNPFNYSSTIFTRNKRYLHIKIQSSPNPQSQKYLPDRPVLSEDSTTGYEFTLKTRDLTISPLAYRLLQIPGIERVFFAKDYISITKNDDSIQWNILNKDIFATIMDYYATGKPIISQKPTITDTTILDTDSDIVAMIKELIEFRIRPSIQEDGGDIYYEGFNEETGKVQIRLAGSCVGCQSSSITLKNGVEKMLMHYIPEVSGIEEVGENVKIMKTNAEEFQSFESELKKNKEKKRRPMSD